MGVYVDLSLDIVWGSLSYLNSICWAPWEKREEKKKKKKKILQVKNQIRFAVFTLKSGIPLVVISNNALNGGKSYFKELNWKKKKKNC